MLYLLDANVLIRAHEDYYPIERVPQFWDWIAEMATMGNIKMPFEIHEEIAIARGPLKEWICQAEIQKALILDEEPDPYVVEQVLYGGYGAGLTDSDLEKIGQDPFLVAYAHNRVGRIVVTKEVSKPRRQGANRKVPDVCNTLGVRWINDFELYRQLNFTTRR